MQQHEFNDEVMRWMKRQTELTTSAYNYLTAALVAAAVNTIAIAAIIIWAVNR
jgi:hypothetical protein